MLSSITNFQKTIWNQWNIRIVILFSLLLQILLIVFAPSRKRTRRFFGSFVWFTYLLADWTAGYCIGLISKNQGHKSKHSQNDCLIAFWGPFLLSHLGGPDTISAFALEDNELWRRHLLALIFQLVTTAYVFQLTLPLNTLWLPTILMFVAGLIKYAERTHALYVAAVNNFRKSLLPAPDAGPNYAKLMEEHSSRQDAGLPAKIIVIPELRQASLEDAKSKTEHGDKTDNEPEGEKKADNELEVVPEGTKKADKEEVHEVAKKDDNEIQVVLEGNKKADQEKVHEGVKKADDNELEPEKKDDKEDYLELVQKAFFFFHKFQGLIVDMIYSFKDRLDSQQYLEKKSAKEALMLIEIELNFMYEVFYTKASVVREYWFWFWGKFISLISIMFTILLFIKAERHSNGFDKLDVWVTYALLSGALVLDVICLLLRFFNDYTATLSDESLRYSYAAPFYQKFQRKLFRYLNKRVLVCYLRWRKPTWSEIKKGPYKKCEKLSTEFLRRRWCGSISGYDLLKYCLDESVPRVVHNKLQGIVVYAQQGFFYLLGKLLDRDLLDQWRYQSTNPFLKVLWEYVFDQLKAKSGEAKDIDAIQSICSARGAWVIQKAKIEFSKHINVDPNEVAAQLESLKPNVDPNEVAAQLESLKPNVDSNEVAALLESLKPHVDSTKLVAALLESLKPHVDSNKVAALLESLKSYVVPNEGTSQFESLKSNVDSIKVTGILESLKPYVDSTKLVTALSENLMPYVDSMNLVAELLESLKPYVDSNKVAAKLESLKPCVDPNEAASQLKRLKSDVDSIIVVATIESLKAYVDPNEVAFDESLLLWHIATALCYVRVEGDKREDATVEGDKREIDGEEKQDKTDERMKISMILSDYMLYLLIMQPNMMSAIAGMAQKRFQDTCEEAKKFFKKRISAKRDRKAMLKEACNVVMKVPTEQKPIDVKGDRSKSLLFDACRLAKMLDKLPNEEKWEIVTSVWVELLSYAACHCRPTGHVQLLSKGGELISFVWLLMVQLGLGTQFQIKDGNARAKLIVGKLLNQIHEASR